MLGRRNLFDITDGGGILKSVMYSVRSGFREAQCIVHSQMLLASLSQQRCDINNCSLYHGLLHLDRLVCHVGYPAR